MKIDLSPIPFSAQQRQALKRLLGRPPAYPNNDFAESFLLRYVFTEALCRQLGKYYRERAGARKKTLAKLHEPIQLDVVGRSFNYFGIRLRSERLAQFLDSALEKRGAKSARNLRNGIVHRWDANDVAEVSERHRSLYSALDAVVEAVACSVNGGK
jgi:hypothetical protein